jgi:hypothetical protein
MASPRKTLKFAAGSVLSDRQLQAIGLVCVEWSMIEFHMHAIASALTTDGSPEREEYLKMLVFRHRLRLLRGLVEAKIIEPWRSDLLSTLSRIGETAQERDRIVHGVWGGPPISVPFDPVNLPEAEKAMDLRARPHFQWKLTYGGIMDVVRKLDYINVTLLNFQIKANGGAPFTTASALQRISRKPDQSP